LLDALFREDGQPLTTLGRSLLMTRIGVTKHLRVVEAADLVTTKGAAARLTGPGFSQTPDVSVR
jgi:DNA-binding MarR family transcriptional regulator